MAAPFSLHLCAATPGLPLELTLSMRREHIMGNDIYSLCGFIYTLHMPKVPPAGALLGLQVTGDLGGVTYVQNKQLRRVAYAKTYPQKTPSQLQEYRRERFRAAVAAWRSLSDQDKSTLDQIAENLKACMSGYNIFISCYLTGQDTWIPGWAEEFNLPWDGLEV